MDCKERILSENYRDIIVDYPPRPGIEEEYDLCYVNLDNLYYLVYINQLGLQPVMSSPYEYQNMPKLYGLMQPKGGMGSESFDPISLTASGIVQVQRQPLSLTGRNVVICFIGCGIDYTNEVFRDENGNTRILAIWDQTDQSGEPPEGFLYGTQYTGEDIDRALQSSAPQNIVPVTDDIGFGSMIAGVAAGSRLGGGSVYLGAAPDAQIVVVKLKECKSYLRDYYMIPRGEPAYEETDIMMAVKYADTFTRVFSRPVVICLGVGTNMGDHSGNSALAMYLNSIAVKRSRAVVVCGGDEGNAAHHFSGMLRRSSDAGGGLPSSGNYRDVEIRVGENNRGFVLEFWGSIPDIFTIAVRTPGGENIPPFRLGIGQSIPYSFIYERSRVTVSSVLVEPVSGEEMMLFRIEEPTAGIWNFRVSAVEEVHNGIFHMWLPITQFLSSEAYFLEPDPNTTLTEPSMAVSVIGVSTYNDLNNSFYIESGRGFSRTGQVRPDFAAPGVNISTIYGRQTGSSLAAAITAGGVAQFMQWAVVEQHSELMQSKEVKNYFIRGASRSADLTYPNREWGEYGIIVSAIL